MEAQYQSPSDWLSYDRDNTARRYSPLAQIRRKNVGGLAPAWTFQYPRVPDRSEATPLARDGVLYVTVGGVAAYALDGRTGRVIWEALYEPVQPGRRADWNRGLAILDNRLFMTTVDGALLCLDSRSGHLLWKVQVADPEKQENTPSAPLIVGARVVIGVGGGIKGEMRGYLDAYDPFSGRHLWRTYTVPAPGEPGSDTWPSTDVWRRGGAATWTTGSYDPELNLLYWPTGNPGPSAYDGSNRPGDNLYANSLLALRPEDGRLVWHFQFTPHDTYDWDANQPVVLIDARWKGVFRKLLVQANRNGLFYVLDRVNGEFLMAKPYALQNWLEEIDPRGRPKVRREAIPTEKGTEVCPDPYGGTNWQSPSFSPDTGLLYVKSRDACARFTPEGPSYEGFRANHSLRAIDVSSGRVRWKIPIVDDGVPSLAGTVTTRGGLVFFGTHQGHFMAADAETGELLWAYNAGGSFRASPMTYAVERRQYVAISSKNALFVFALIGDQVMEQGGA